MADRLKVGIVGATGMVGQRFVSLLADHPWFQVTTVAASERSAGKAYAEAVGNRWVMPTPVPPAIAKLVVKNAAKVDDVAGGVDFIFCAVDMPKDEIRALEDSYAKSETPVVSNNSAQRWTPDVPMLLPEVNAGHLSVIEAQQKRLGTRPSDLGELRPSILDLLTQPRLCCLPLCSKARLDLRLCLRSVLHTIAKGGQRLALPWDQEWSH